MAEFPIPEAAYMNDFNFPTDYALDLELQIRENLSDLFNGRFSSHAEYPVFYTYKSYPLKSVTEPSPGFEHGFPEVIKKWAKLSQDTNWKREDLLVLDLETTGLSRGETLAFLIGMGYYEQDQFIVEQIFLPRPEAEINSFDRIIELLQSKSLLVTFNGKTFDLPILESRFMHNHIWCELRRMEHLDVLHLARKLWKNKAPSCALETLEYYILGQIRDSELEISGSLIPQTYYQYLVQGEVDLLRRVFIHNQHDVFNTALLLDLICEHLQMPVHCGADYRIDYHAVARLFLEQGCASEGMRIMEELINQGVLTDQLAYDLGVLYKRQEKTLLAEECFLKGSALGDHKSRKELAMLYEKQRRYPDAIRITQLILQKEYLSLNLTSSHLEDAQKRLNRLEKKLRLASEKADKSKK